MAKISKTDTESIIKTAEELYEYGLEFVRKWCENNNIDFESEE